MLTIPCFVSARGFAIVALILLSYVFFSQAFAINHEVTDADWSVMNPQGLRGTNGSIYALATGKDGCLYIAGNFTAAGNVLANNIVKWDGKSYSPLGSGIQSTVNFDGKLGIRALSIDSSGTIYAAGWFSLAGGLSACNIAKWDGQRWSAVGAGLDSVVYALTSDGAGNLYAGGIFKSAGGIPSHCIAMWDGKSWHSLDFNLQVGGNVNAVVTDGKTVYFGGSFIDEGPNKDTNIARWNPSHPDSLHIPSVFLNYAANFGVLSLAFGPGGKLYAGSSSQTSPSSIKMWDGIRWNDLPWNPDPGVVVAMDGDNAGQLLVAITNTANLNSNYFLEKWDGQSWTLFGKCSFSIYTITHDAVGNVFAGGYFGAVNGLRVNAIARWDTQWHALGSGIQQIQEGVADDSGNFYITSQVEDTNGLFVDVVLKGNGKTWDTLDSRVSGGLTSSSQGFINNTITHLGVDPSGNVYAGGNFTRIGGTDANCIAKWDGKRWSPLGAGIDIVAWDGPLGTQYSYINSIVADNAGNLYVKGYFSTVGGKQINDLAQWNGVEWKALPQRVFGETYNAMTVDGSGNFYLQGRLFDKNGSLVDELIKWNGTAWSVLAGPYRVLGLVFDGRGSLYMAGEIGDNGNSNFPKIIARFDGSQWSGLGSGIQVGTVTSLSVDKANSIYAGGEFSQAGDRAANSIAKWDGTSWHSLGSGLLTESNYPALITNIMVHDSTLFVIGGFWFAGGKTSPRFARVNCIGTGTDAAPPKPSNPASVVRVRLVKSNLLVFNIGPRDDIAIFKLDGRRIKHISGISKIDLSSLAPQVMYVKIFRNGKTIYARMVVPEQ